MSVEGVYQIIETDQATGRIPTRYIDIAGGRLAFSDSSGLGEPVIMVPGMGALRSEYRYLSPQLQKAGYRGITMDVRGHGESSIPWDDYEVSSVGRDILSLTDYFGFNLIHLIGTSKSAGAVVWVAAERPDIVKSIVLISPFVHNSGTSVFMKAMFWLLMHNPWKVSSWTSYYQSLYPSDKPGDFNEYMDALARNLREKGRMDAAYRYGNASLVESECRLRHLHAPVQVVMGTKDPDFPDPQSEARQIADETGGELLMVEGAGHYPQTEMSDKTNPAIVDFIRYCTENS